MSLPPLLAGWLTGLVPEAPMPEEPRASCAACPQCDGTAASEALPAALRTFDPVSRCCTYLPVLRNFQVGAALADPSAPGRASVQARVAAGVAVTPLGLLWPASFARAYDEGQEDRFGRRRELRCPHHLDDGRCGVWAHRNSTCSTWFCRYERGDVGRRYWGAARRLLDLAEDAVGWWCVEQLDVGDEALALLRSGDGPRGRLDGDAPIDEAARRRVWGRWHGREEALYAAAWALVADVTVDDLRRIGGGRLREAAEDVALAADDLTPRRLPPFLRWTGPSVAHEEPHQRWVHGYRAYDPIPVPVAALRALDGASGVDVDALRRDLTAAGVHDVDGLLRRLVDHGALVAALPGVSG